MTAAVVSAPSRVVAAVSMLTVRPSDHILEVGCGNGAAAASVCEQLDDGLVVGIDRSETQIALARQRNRACVDAGTAAFHVMTLEDATLSDTHFDTIFAINVNAFWLRHARPLAAVRRLLKTDGAFFLFYEHPATAKARQVSRVLRDNLAGAGFVVGHESSDRVYCLKSSLRQGYTQEHT